MVHTCSLFICSASPPSLRRLVSAPTSHRWILIAPANFSWGFPPKGGWHLLWYSQLLCLHCLAVLSQFYVSELMGVGLHIAPPQLSKEHGWRRTERFSDSLQENAFWKGHSSFYMASTWIGLCFMHSGGNFVIFWVPPGDPIRKFPSPQGSQETASTRQVCNPEGKTEQLWNHHF